MLPVLLVEVVVQIPRMGQEMLLIQEFVIPSQVMEDVSLY